MLYRDIIKIFGLYLFGLAATMMLPLVVAGYYQFLAPTAAHPQPHTVSVFLLTVAVTLAVGALCYWWGRRSCGTLYRREGIFLVVLIWLLTPAIAALPYLLSGTLSNPFQAYFEATSGLTTTGATTLFPKQYDSDGKEIAYTYTVMGVHPITYTYYGTVEPIRDPVSGAIIHEGIEAVSKAILFWRSFTQWLGGMGIIVLFVAILPALGVGGKQLFHAEMPGPVKGSLTPRIKETASSLWKIYLALSCIELVMLLFTNSELPIFDAITITLSNVSTGGFSIRNASIGTYNSVATEWVVIAFMIISSINFSLYFHALRGRLYRLYDKELFLYIAMLLVSCGLVAYFLVGTKLLLLTDAPPDTFNVEESIRYSLFQVISAHTTTGFVTANYDIWPYTTQVILILVMFLGGMAGSTAGGTKVMRHYMLFRITQYKVESIFRPENVRNFRVADSDVDASAAVRVLCYFVIIIGFATLGTFLFIMDNIDPETAFAVVTCMINNIGIAFRMDGPTQSCAFLSNFSLSLSTFLMILGRLEFYALLAVLVPAFWKQHS